MKYEGIKGTIGKGLIKQVVMQRGIPFEVRFLLKNLK